MRRNVGAQTRKKRGFGGLFLKGGSFLRGGFKDGGGRWGGGVVNVAPTHIRSFSLSLGGLLRIQVVFGSVLERNGDGRGSKILGGPAEEGGPAEGCPVWVGNTTQQHNTQEENTRHKTTPTTTQCNTQQRIGQKWIGQHWLAKWAARWSWKDTLIPKEFAVGRILCQCATKRCREVSGRQTCF